jgi:hypothetical protein
MRWFMLSKSRLVALFLLARIVTFISLPIEGLRGYGDFSNFFGLASQPGWPYLNFWVEFPPVFPFFSSLMYRIAGGQEHVYIYLVLIVLTAADAGNLLLFRRFSVKFFSSQGANLRILTYGTILVVLPYTWWYFDSLAVFFMLLGISLVLDQKEYRAGLIIGIGFLVKFFPLAGLIAGWKSFSWRRILRVAVTGFGVGILIYGILWAFSPDYTRASLFSQAGKGSWETVWALIDGNYSTGAMAPPDVRQNINSISMNMAVNPARIPPWMTLVLFGAAGAWALLKSKVETDRQAIQAVCFAWGMFLLWTPGYSPQWILYWIPMILLSMPERQGSLFIAVLVLVNLAEWPLLLSRGMFWTLNITVPVRFVLTGLLTLQTYYLLHGNIQEK